MCEPTELSQNIAFQRAAPPWFPLPPKIFLFEFPAASRVWHLPQEVTCPQALSSLGVCARPASSSLWWSCRCCMSELHSVSPETPTMRVPPQVPNPQECFSHPSISAPFFTSLLPSWNALCTSHEKIVLPVPHWLILKKISYLSERLQKTSFKRPLRQKGKIFLCSFVHAFGQQLLLFCDLDTSHCVSIFLLNYFRRDEPSVLTGSSHCRESPFWSAGHCCHESCWKK